MSQEIISALGLNIARYRKAEGLSAAELANRAEEGLTRSIIANLESGRKNDLSVRQLASIANVLRVPPVALVVDLFAPGEEAPYPMPAVDLQAFNPKTLKIEPASTSTRNADFIRWFSGESFFPSENIEGAPEIARGVLSTIQGYRQSWNAFNRALQRLVNFGKEEENEDLEVSNERKDREARLIEEAVTTVRWARDLRMKGVKFRDIESDIEQILDHFNIKFDFDRDSHQFPSYTFNDLTP